VTPAAGAYVAPPAPRGRARRKGKGYAANGMTNTELGDRVEAALVEQLGFESALDGRRQGAFDLRLGDRVFEVKAVTVESSEFKMKPKRVEVERKLAAARRSGTTPASIIAVVDGKRVLVYWRDGIGAFRLNADWHFAGTVAI
jgi:hypothetical protein